MKRIVVFGQPGRFGESACAIVADRLAQRFSLPRLAAVAAERLSDIAEAKGWVATSAVGAFSERLFRAADTAVWLHYSPLAVAREWTRGVRSRLSTFAMSDCVPRLADLRDSLWHMDRTPQVHGLLQQPSMAHLHVCHLRSPGETVFWLHAQDHRLLQVAAPQLA